MFVNCEISKFSCAPDLKGWRTLSPSPLHQKSPSLFSLSFFPVIFLTSFVIFIDQSKKNLTNKQAETWSKSFGLFWRQKMVTEWSAFLLCLVIHHLLCGIVSGNTGPIDAPWKLALKHSTAHFVPCRRHRGRRNPPHTLHGLPPRRALGPCSAPAVAAGRHRLR